MRAPVGKLRLDDVCRIEYGTRVVKKRDAGSVYPVYGGGGASFMMDSFNRENRVVVSRFGMSPVCTRFVAGRFFLNDSGLTVAPKSESLRQRYLDYQILWLNDVIYGLGKGAAQLNLDVDAFRGLSILVPESLDEQDRVVELLDEALGDIDNAQSLSRTSMAEAVELFDSEVSRVFSEVDHSCEHVLLGSHVDLLPGFAFKSVRYTEEDGDVALLRGDNIVPGGLRWRGVKRWPKADATDHAKFELRAGDIVVAMDRPWVSAGLKCAMVQEADLPALLVQRVARLRCDEGLDPDYLMQLLRGSGFKDYILGVQTGIGVPHISGKQIQGFRFGLPSIEDQRRLAERLDDLKSLLENYRSLLLERHSETGSLRMSLLEAAFTDRL